MSGETEKDISGWTIDTSREDILSLLKERDLRYEQRFKAQEEAVAKSDTASEKRFDSVNEFRKTLSDQTSTFLPRKEYDAQHKALEDKVSDVTDRINKTEGKSSGIGAVGGAIGVGVGLLIAAVSVILTFNN